MSKEKEETRGVQIIIMSNPHIPELSLAALSVQTSSLGSARSVREAMVKDGKKIVYRPVERGASQPSSDHSAQAPEAKSKSTVPTPARAAAPSQTESTVIPPPFCTGRSLDRIPLTPPPLIPPPPKRKSPELESSPPRSKPKSIPALREIHKVDILVDNQFY